MSRLFVAAKAKGCVEQGFGFLYGAVPLLPSLTPLFKEIHLHF